MNRLLIVSNRLPFTVQKRGNGLQLQQSVGGLATGLGSIYQSQDSIWVGWPGISSKKISPGEKASLAEALARQKCVPVYLSEYEIEKYYYGFCNRALWPLLHYFYQYAEYDPSCWKVYTNVNKKFCDAVCEEYQPGDIVWVHDYQLMLVPGMIREKLPDAAVGFFLHIPFPPYELFRLLPWRKEVLKGLTGADLIGFHTFEYVNYFLNNTRRILGYEHEMTRVKTGKRTVFVDTFPMGIDYHRFAEAVNRPDVKKEIKRLRRIVGMSRTLLSVDRLDYTKGVPLRLKAFDLFLDAYPEWKERVTLIVVAVPSRTRIEQYTALKHEVDQLVGTINGKHGTMGWTPVQYLYTFLPFPTLVALYRIADLALITPVRDGMNLMAKEYLAANREEHGMLILSEFAGAAKELGEAILINPNDMNEFAGAIHEGLMMPEDEKEKRLSVMQTRLQRYDLNRWTSDFLDALKRSRDYQKMLMHRCIGEQELSRMLGECRNSKKRLLLLDYDGTLVPIAPTPEAARPDAEIRALLENLSREEKNDIVIISGRKRSVLERWFAGLSISFIAEHGVWIRARGKEWEMPSVVSGEWKDEIRPILEIYVDRTPGSFIEEKEYSLAWHFRNTDPGLAGIRAIEVKEDLMLRSKDLNLAILEGDKVLEIKDAIINKGAAARHWLRQNRAEFIVAIGDDRTDEDLFAALPSDAYSIKVGGSPSVAKFSVRSVDEVRELLRKCTLL